MNQESGIKKEYLHWNEKTLEDISNESVSHAYNEGYVYTRIGKGVMHQTRSCRIDLSKFELSSENRRILKKTEGLEVSSDTLPLEDYNFSLGKLAKDFYDTKFEKGTMSAQKVKEMLTDPVNSNFNSLLNFSLDSKTIGHAICYENKDLLHYSYPFYDLNTAPKDMGLGMMIRAIIWAKTENKKYAYLGSLQRQSDTYKIQFSGLQWFDGTKWQEDTEQLKEVLAKIE